jgi:hypothetical protein
MLLQRAAGRDFARIMICPAHSRGAKHFPLCACAQCAADLFCFGARCGWRAELPTLSLCSSPSERLPWPAALVHHRHTHAVRTSPAHAASAAGSGAHSLAAAPTTVWGRPGIHFGHADKRRLPRWPVRVLGLVVRGAHAAVPVWPRGQVCEQCAGGWVRGLQERRCCHTVSYSERRAQMESSASLPPPRMALLAATARRA